MILENNEEKRSTLWRTIVAISSILIVIVAVFFVTLEVYEFLDGVDHKTENLFHEQRRHRDGREFDEYIITTEGVGAYGETPEEYLCRVETLHELMAVLDTCTEA